MFNFSFFYIIYVLLSFFFVFSLAVVLVLFTCYGSNAVSIIYLISFYVIYFRTNNVVIVEL